MRADLLFETNRFNLSEEKEHFINPCCFGEDVAAWLREKLMEKGIKASLPGQEDWGWYVEAEYQGGWYFIGIGGNPKDSSEELNRGEWHIFVDKVRSVRERVIRQDTMAGAEELIKVIQEMVEQEVGIENVRFE